MKKISYFIYPETQAQLDVSTDILSDNGVRFRVGQEYQHNPKNPFVATIKNYALEIFCDYEKFCFMKHLIGERLDDIVYLENNLKSPFEFKLKPESKSEFEDVFIAEYGTEKSVDIPEFMKEEVKQ